MLAQLVIALVLSLLRYMPRPNPAPEHTHPIPDDTPPDADEPPSGQLPHQLPDVTFEKPPGTRHPHPPSVPPTPPPGFEGEWPPASERPTGPNMPPPGHRGDGSNITDALKDLMRQIRELLRDRNPMMMRARADDGIGLLANADMDTGSGADVQKT